MARRLGKVMWFNKAKGFGFISQGEGGPEVFCHFSAIETEGYKFLTEGEPVEFDVVQGGKGPEAAKVKRLKS